MMTFEKTVLVLEDEIIVAMDIGDELIDRGWHVTDVVGTLDAAMRAVAAATPDLALLDVNLRGSQSFDLALDLKARGTVVVFLSGNSVNDLPEALRGCAFIEKPVNYDALHSALLAAARPGGTAAAG